MFARYVGQLRGAPCYILDKRLQCLVTARAWVLGRRIIFRTVKDFKDASVRLHEAEHVRQRNAVGPLYPLVYMVFNLIYGYKRNPFEVKARKAALRP